MVVRWSVAAVAAAGCAAIPDDPNGEPLIDVDVSGGRVSTTSRSPLAFTIQFSPGGARMPQSILLDGINRIADGACPTESGVGIGVYPALVASPPTLGGSAAMSTLEFDFSGPTIARATVTWSAHYECVLAPQRASGTSTFTIFPNGRIVRHDVATPSTTTLTVDSNPCGCTAQTNFFFTSFWTFAQTQSVNGDGSPFTQGARACAVYDGHTIGLAWPDGNARVIPDNGVSAFDYTWVADSPTLEPVQQELTSAIMLSNQTGAASCGSVLADLDDFPIMVAGSQVITDDSGIYDDSRQHSERIDITAPRRLPRGFAIALDVGSFAEVTRSPAVEGRWYATQPDGDRTIFWFRDALGVGEMISIDPQ